MEHGEKEGLRSKEWYVVDSLIRHDLHLKVTWIDLCVRVGVGVFYCRDGCFVWGDKRVKRDSVFVAKG